MSHDPTKLWPQVGATGVRFVSKLVDQEGDPITLSATPTVMEFRFEKPSGANVTKGATKTGPNEISWSIPSNQGSFLDEHGQWRVQAWVEDGETYPGQVTIFQVKPNLDEAP